MRWICVLLATSVVATSPWLLPQSARAQSDPATSQNFGSASVLKNTTSPDTRGFLKFNVAGINGRVTSATFRAFTQSSSGSGYELHSVADNTWTEGGLNFNNKPA